MSCKDRGPGSRAGGQPKLPAAVLGLQPMFTTEQGSVESRSFVSSAFPSREWKGCRFRCVSA